MNFSQQSLTRDQQRYFAKGMLMDPWKIHQRPFVVGVNVPVTATTKMTRYKATNIPSILGETIAMHEGIILLADISGFTKFVKKIDPRIGVHVIHDLLNSIIDRNEFGLNVNEIEGDAVLFYRIGKPLSMQEVVQQFESMSKSFFEKLTTFNPVLLEHKLSLKVIVHYGSFSTYNIDGFTKLYGIPVIEAHRLLKNSISGNHYLLVTEDYLQAAGENLQDSPFAFHLCEVYDDVGVLCYYYLSKPSNFITFAQSAPPLLPDSKQFQDSFGGCHLSTDQVLKGRAEIGKIN